MPFLAITAQSLKPNSFQMVSPYESSPILKGHFWFAVGVADQKMFHCNGLAS